MPSENSLALKGVSFSMCLFSQKAILEGANGPCLGKPDSAVSLKNPKSTSFIPHHLYFTSLS